VKTRTGYLIRRGKVFYAVWTVAGKKFMQSTGKRDRREAETELRRIMQPFAAEHEVDILRSIAAKIEGRTAELTRLEDERTPPLTVAAVWPAYMSAENRPDSGPGTLSMYEGQFAAFADWLKRTHPNAAALRDVTPPMAREYTAHLAGERGLSPNSYNKHVHLLELVFRVLKDPGRLTVNPWEGIQRKRVAKGERRALTTHELRAVCAAASGEMRLLFAVGIYTGLRLGDAATLRWAEVDLIRRMIRRVPNKTARYVDVNGQPRSVIIPIHPTLADMLIAPPASERGEYVLPETAALYLKETADLSKRIQDHFAACGIKTAKRGTGFETVKDKDGEAKRISTGKRAVVEVGFHSLRHYAEFRIMPSRLPIAA